MRVCSTVAVAVSLAMGIASSQVNAQAPSGSSAQAGGALDEIRVTARRRDESLQDVPTSIQAFSGDALQVRGLERVEDVIAAAPNVMMSAGPRTAGSTFAMRGIPRAGYFVDDVWEQSTIARGAQSLVEIDRVEILRGPQGTLYGRDTTGGAIRVYTKLPDVEFGVRGRATFGSYRRRDVTLHADLPVTDELLTKVSFSNLQRDGFVRSLTVDREYGDLDDRQIRGDMLWTPTNRLQARLTLEDHKFRGTQPNVTLAIFDPGEPGVDPGAIDPEGRNMFWIPPHQYYDLLGIQYDCQSHVMNCPGGEVGDLETKNNFQGPPGIDLNRQRATLRVEYDLTDRLHLMSLSSYKELDSWDYNNFSAADVQFFSQGNVSARESWSQEFQLTGSGERLNWVFGAFGWGQDLVTRFNRWALWEFATGELDFADVAGSPECQAWNPASGLIPCIQVPPSQDSFTAEREEGYAFFGEATYDVTSTLSLTVGARYHRQKNTDWTLLFADNTAPRAGIPGHLSAGNYLVHDGKTDEIAIKFNETTFRVALTNDFTDSIMGYVGFSQGFNAGGNSRVQIFDLDNNAINFDFPYDPEQIDNYEIGLRTEWMGGRLRANVTGFYTEWDDIQLSGTVTNPFTGEVLPTFLITNAATAEARGIESEILFAPTGNLLFNFDFGYLNTKYTDIAEGSELEAGAPFGMAPKWQVSTGGQWDTLLPNGHELMFRLDYRWTDGYNRTFVPGDHSTRFTGRKFEQGPFGLLNARIAYRPRGDGLEIALYGTNLTDSRYTTGGFMSPLLQIDNGVIGRPRELGVTVGFEF